MGFLSMIKPKLDSLFDGLWDYQGSQFEDLTLTTINSIQQKMVRVECIGVNSYGCSP